MLMNRTILNLDGAWSLWLAPHSEIRKRNFSAETSDALKASGFCHIDAEVPGNFELDMHRAGLLPDPYFGTNPLLCQKEENKHLWYTKTFEIDALPEDTLFLNWSYAPDPPEDKIAVFAKSGRTQIVCPSTNSWLRFCEIVEREESNIITLAEYSDDFF
jgi:hypothetical protein